jgi:hypothetical protein
MKTTADIYTYNEDLNSKKAEKSKETGLTRPTKIFCHVVLRFVFVLQTYDKNHSTAFQSKYKKNIRLNPENK